MATALDRELMDDSNFWRSSIIADIAESFGLSTDVEAVSDRRVLFVGDPSGPSTRDMFDNAIDTSEIKQSICANP